VNFKNLIATRILTIFHKSETQHVHTNSLGIIDMLNYYNINYRMSLFSYMFLSLHDSVNVRNFKMTHLES
jgi:hypothetical protein